MISNFLSEELIQAFAWTFLHSLWQITLIAIILSFVLRRLKNTNASKRYYVSFFALGLSVLFSVFTFSVYYHVPESTMTELKSSLLYQAQLAANSANSEGLALGHLLSDYSLLIVNAWIIGAFLFLMRFLGGFIYLRKIVKASTSTETKHNNVLNKLASKYKINRKIDLKESIQVTTPMVVGFFKPVILFPIGLINNLSTKEVESILAHELAHIKRHDYLLNSVQIIAESIFYFHPAIWYISSKINQERENCCDDLAIKHTKSSISYAKTLVKLQELQTQVIKPALAFSGNKGNFKSRIERILGQSAKTSFRKDKLTVFIVLFVSILFSVNELQSTNEVSSTEFDLYVIDDCPKDVKDIKFYLDTIPDRNSFKIKKKSRTEDIEIQMEDGEITSLKIDGEEIPSEKYAEHSDVINKLKPSEDREIITLFPECDEDLGSVYFYNQLNDSAFNLDSLVTELKSKQMDFKNFDFGFLDHDFDQFEEMMVDSLTQKMLERKDLFPDFGNKSLLHLDSIFDVFPDRMAFKFFDSNPFENELEKFNFPGPNGFDGFENKDYPSFFGETQKVSDIISRSLLKDELISKEEKAQIELSGKWLKINGEKQPSNIWKKYKSIYERNTGIELKKNSYVEIEIDPAQCFSRKRKNI